MILGGKRDAFIWHSRSAEPLRPSDDHLHPSAAMRDRNQAFVMHCCHRCSARQNLRRRLSAIDQVMLEMQEPHRSPDLALVGVGKWLRGRADVK